jgi:hypothetical protein
MAIFAVIGVAVVSLLANGMNAFTAGTSDTSMQDRLAAAMPSIREDFANVYVPDHLGVPPPPAIEGGGPLTGPVGTPPAPVPPGVRFRSGWVKLADLPPEKSVWVFYCAFVRANAREAEDPILRTAGSAGASGTELKTYDPASVDSGVTGNLMAPGGVMEVAYVAVPEDFEKPGILTVYRLFRAPVGGKKTLLDPANLDSLAEIRAAGRPRVDGVLHFQVRLRNVFAKAWDVPLKGRLQDGEPYVGDVWDSTRGIDKDFALYRDGTSVANPDDDVFPAWARIELTLAEPGAYGYGRGDTTLALSCTAEETRLTLADPSFLMGPGPYERWIKVDTEWMVTSQDKVDLESRVVTVGRDKGRKAVRREHKEGDPVYYGSSVATELSLLYEDAYVQRK